MLKKSKKNFAYGCFSSFEGQKLVVATWTNPSPWSIAPLSQIKSKLERLQDEDYLSRSRDGSNHFNVLIIIIVRILSNQKLLLSKSAGIIQGDRICFYKQEIVLIKRGDWMIFHTSSFFLPCHFYTLSIFELAIPSKHSMYKWLSQKPYQCLTSFLEIFVN